MEFRNGQGVAQDYWQALKWFRSAAEQGAAVAQFNLGEMYENGQGVARDRREAIKWFKLAAEEEQRRVTPWRRTALTVTLTQKCAACA
jgi:TPR repeat protein